MGQGKIFNITGQAPLQEKTKCAIRVNSIVYKSAPGALSGKLAKKM